MTTHDIVMILVLTFPMFLFSIYPGIALSDYLEQNHHINEKQKRTVMVSITFISALILSSLFHLA